MDNWQTAETKQEENRRMKAKENRSHRGERRVRQGVMVNLVATATGRGEAKNRDI